MALAERPEQGLHELSVGCRVQAQPPELCRGCRLPSLEIKLGLGMGVVTLVLSAGRSSLTGPSSVVKAGAS